MNLIIIFRHLVITHQGNWLNRQIDWIRELKFQPWGTIIIACLSVCILIIINSKVCRICTTFIYTAYACWIGSNHCCTPNCGIGVIPTMALSRVLYCFRMKNKVWTIQHWLYPKLFMEWDCWTKSTSTIFTKILPWLSSLVWDQVSTIRTFCVDSHFMYWPRFWPHWRV